METKEYEKQFQYCTSCKKETFQKLELYDPDDLQSDLIWVCEECKEGVSFSLKNLITILI